ncbi:MAG: hypothetical protein ACTSSP_04095 [Candidatus Asgardarchaeia archaeon]
MVIGISFIVLAVLIIAIWLVIELKRFKHKIFAIFLIVLILLTYFSFSVVLKDKDLNLGSISGMVTAGELYGSWMGSVFENLKEIFNKIIHMDWSSG